MNEGQSYEVLDVRLKALETNMENLEGRIEELIKILNQAQGVLNTLKVIFYVTAPLVAGVIWLKDHVKI